ncbi:alpha/beta hydrolase [Micromonospora sp. IBHARD004]|uniref:alpha/beta hydrolase n=1 Tax=Micromonospora sp. IBHARD004 TaxID=3457764 RepID=UPI0040597F32
MASVLATITEPTVVVGHTYGAIVMTNAATGNPNVNALVYIAACAPDDGEPLVALQTRFPGSRLGLEALDIRPTGPESFDGYIKPSVFREIFAADLPLSTTAVMAATQRLGDLGTLQQPSGPPGWKAIPSWYLVAKQDQVIPAAAQRFMAERAGARTKDVDASHVAMMSRPDAARTGVRPGGAAVSAIRECRGGYRCSSMR